MNQRVETMARAVRQIGLPEKGSEIGPERRSQLSRPIPNPRRRSPIGSIRAAFCGCVAVVSAPEAGTVVEFAAAATGRARVATFAARCRRTACTRCIVSDPARSSAARSATVSGGSRVKVAGFGVGTPPRRPMPGVAAPGTAAAPALYRGGSAQMEPSAASALLTIMLSARNGVGAEFCVLTRGEVARRPNTMTAVVAKTDL